MSENQAVLREAFAAPDIEAEYLGHVGLRRLFARTVGDDVVVRVRFRAEGREGMRVDMQQGHRYRFRDGLVARYNGYGGFDEALEAAP
jgi:hypothetical protein